MDTETKTEKKSIDRAFVEKYLPKVYMIAMEHTSSAELAKLASKRMFAKAQEALEAGTLPEGEALEQWLVALAEKEAKELGRNSSSADTGAQTHQSARVGAERAPRRAASQEGKEAHGGGASRGEAARETEPWLALRADAAGRGSEALHREKPATASAVNPVLIALFAALALISLWFLLGLIGAKGFLNVADIGYSWFDGAVFTLFGY